MQARSLSAGPVIAASIEAGMPAGFPSSVQPAAGACAALVGAMASKHDFGGTAYRLSILQGVSMGRRSEIEAEARKSGSIVTSVSVAGVTVWIASGEIDVPPSALVS